VTEPEGSETAARCAVHPERPAEGGTCDRCGSFMCAECRLSGRDRPLCEACQRRLESGRFVGQVPLFGIALMVHGGLVLGLGLLVTAYGGFLLEAFASMDAPQPTPDDPGAAMLPDFLVGSMAAVGLANTLVGALQLWAGWRIRVYRSRGLGLAALCSGLITVVGCYCAPTSLGMLVWGLVILLSGDVADRFATEREVA